MEQEKKKVKTNTAKYAFGVLYLTHAICYVVHNGFFSYNTTIICYSNGIIRKDLTKLADDIYMAQENYIHMIVKEVLIFHNSLYGTN